MPIDPHILNRITKNDSKLKKLDLSNKKLTDADIAILVAAFENNTHLIEMNLRNNKISNQGAKDLAKVTTLKKLKLFNGNNIGDDGLKAFLKNTALIEFPIVGGSGQTIKDVRAHIKNNSTRPNIVAKNFTEIKTPPLKPILKEVKEVKLAIKPIPKVLIKDLKLNPPKQTTYGQPAHAPIQVSFRNDQGKRMHGAFYDHYLLRKITGHSTQIRLAPEKKIDNLKNFINQTVFALGIGAEAGKKIIPTIADENSNNEGLLFIPGRPRDDKDTTRAAYEKDLIKKARNRGQPILAICAGSWQLWQAYGGKIKDVTDHVYSSMPYILEGEAKAGGVGNNKQIHRIKLTKNTLVKKMMKLPHVAKKDHETFPTVNSVHWAAPDETTRPETLIISAKSQRCDSLKTNNRQGNESKPEENTVEAFEAKDGAPVVGIQWHPEAYFEMKKPDKINPENKRHLNLITFMAKAGDTYQQKRRLIKELSEIDNVGSLLRKTGFFKETKSESKMNTTIKRPKPLNKKIISEEKINDPQSIYYQPRSKRT